MTTLATPVITNLRPREMSVTLYVEMQLASVPVTVSGQYNIHSNCFYPSSVVPHMDLDSVQDSDDDKLEAMKSYDLELFCNRLGWEYYETQDLIQAAVEKRDQ